MAGGDRVRPGRKDPRRQRSLPEDGRLRPLRGRRTAPCHVRSARSAARRPTGPSGRTSGPARPSRPSSPASARAARRIWLQATYTPICGTDGKRPFKVIKYASDITPIKERDGECAGAARGDPQVAGRDRVRHGRHGAGRQRELPERAGLHAGRDQGPAPFDVRAALERGTDAYSAFWKKLGRGEYDESQYLRIGKGGRQVWIQASYNRSSIPSASRSRW